MSVGERIKIFWNDLSQKERIATAAFLPIALLIFYFGWPYLLAIGLLFGFRWYWRKVLSGSWTVGKKLAVTVICALLLTEISVQTHPAGCFGQGTHDDTKVARKWLPGQESQRAAEEAAAAQAAERCNAVQRAIYTGSFRDSPKTGWRYRDMADGLFQGILTLLYSLLGWTGLAAVVIAIQRLRWRKRSLAVSILLLLPAALATKGLLDWSFYAAQWRLHGPGEIVGYVVSGSVLFALTSYLWAKDWEDAF